MATKQTTIRGDTLLFAITVLSTVGNPMPKIPQRKAWQVMQSLESRHGLAPNSRISAYNEWATNYKRRMLEAATACLEQVQFDIIKLIRDVTDKDVYRFLTFFLEAFAKGELTEADFREAE